VKALCAGVPGEDGVVERDAEDGVLAGLDDVGELRELELLLDALRDVLRRPGHHDRPALGVDAHLAAPVNHADAAVRTDDAVVEREGPAVRDAAAEDAV